MSSVKECGGCRVLFCFFKEPLSVAGRGFTFLLLLLLFSKGCTDYLFIFFFLFASINLAALYYINGVRYFNESQLISSFFSSPLSPKFATRCFSFSLCLLLLVVFPFVPCVCA